MSDQLLKSTTTVSGMTFLSRIVGFVRDVVLAHLFGASAGFDAFLVAFKIPNFMRRLFAEGAFSQAFVPVLSEYQTHRSEREVKRFINHVFGVLGLVLCGITLLGVVASPAIIHVFAPGFSADPSRFDLACNLLRITFPYLLFISLTAFAAGIQNTYNRFAVPAFTPVLLNVSLIVSAIWMSSRFAHGVYALAWGVIIAGVAQFLFQLPFLSRLKLLPKPTWGWHDEGVRRVITLMVPALIGASVMQINLLVDTIFASFLPVGSLTWLYYSDRLLEFPIGIFGVALATVVLPHLSKEHAKQSQRGFSASLDWALRWILLIGLPASLGLMLIAAPLLTTLFQYGKFTTFDVTMATKSLVAFSTGLVFFLSVKILVSAFYARQNTRLPVKVACVAMGVNVLFNALLIGPMAHAGLALASAISSMTNVFALLWLLLRQGIYVPLPGWMRFAVRLALANSALVAFLWWMTPPMAQWFSWGAFDRVVGLCGLMLGSVLAYFGGLWLTGLRYAHMRLESA